MLSYSSADMTSSARIGANIRALRSTAKLTQAQLGERINSDGPRVGRLEKGVENPTIETLDKLAAALAVDVHQLTAPRPEELTADEHGRDRVGEGHHLLDNILRELDEEAPASNTLRGDILKAQHALAGAQAALARALRRSDADESPAARDRPARATRR